ncbi:MAG TPA: hypothetical protein VFP10_02340, partial [Candidatus Eisenbacteria bacterium]|nr:hypothetical protein [Candidatus Eisenbacteria bacterium]
MSGGISGVAYSHHWTNFTDPTARGPAVPGVTVSLRYCKRWTKPALQTPWTCTLWASKQTTTDSNGAFSISVSDAVNPPSGTIGGMVASASVQNADETPTWWIPTFNGSFVNGNFLRVPLMRSPAKTVWLRRYGTGDYPFFFVEGFDPQNGTWTGDETAPGNNSSLTQAPSILRIMRNSPIGSAVVNTTTREAPAGANNNMLDWLVANNYSVYVIASGSNWGTSQKGMLADHSDGIAYQAMALIKQVRNRFAPSSVAIVGGYSLGGSVVRTGLLHWCNGDFSSVPGSELTTGCPEIGLWWGADSPLDSATVP